MHKNSMVNLGKMHKANSFRRFRRKVTDFTVKAYIIKVFTIKSIYNKKVFIIKKSCKNSMSFYSYSVKMLSRFLFGMEFFWNILFINIIKVAEDQGVVVIFNSVG